MTSCFTLYFWQLSGNDCIPSLGPSIVFLSSKCYTYYCPHGTKTIFSEDTNEVMFENTRKLPCSLGSQTCSDSQLSRPCYGKLSIPDRTNVALYGTHLYHDIEVYLAFTEFKKTLKRLIPRLKLLVTS